MLRTRASARSRYTGAGSDRFAEPRNAKRADGHSHVQAATHEGFVTDQLTNSHRTPLSRIETFGVLRLAHGRRQDSQLTDESAVISVCDDSTGSSDRPPEKIGFQARIWGIRHESLPQGSAAGPVVGLPRRAPFRGGRPLRSKHLLRGVPGPMNDPPSLMGPLRLLFPVGWPARPILRLRLRASRCSVVTCA